MADFTRGALIIAALAGVANVAMAPGVSAEPLGPIAVLCTGSADGSGGTCGRWTGSSHYTHGPDSGVGRAASSLDEHVP